MFGLAMALAVETIALHALFMRSHPLIAWLLTATSVYALWWIMSDYRAMGRGAILVADDNVEIRVGRRVDVTVPLSQIASASQPSWRERPRPAPDYLNATKPAEPNVLLVLESPVRARVIGGMHRSVSRIGVRVDDPAAFVARVEKNAAGFRPPRSKSDRD